MSNPLAALAAEAHKLGADAVAVFHHDAEKVEAEVHDGITAVQADVANGKSFLLKAVENEAPEIKAAVENSLNGLEKMLLTSLASHLPF
jgi:hypothetical protein